MAALWVTSNCADAATPEAALKQMKVAEGFEVSLVASEPQIRQPVSISFDDRGRMWVIQYLQYPTPAGLAPVSVDAFLRTKYDHLPEPPPHGPRGADRITICDKGATKDFIAGLNLCSGLALGHGGVFVAQPPYLLFYPDRNRDDIPDGDPEVLLTGFGMEDAHAFANSLTWGPDGWLYGAQGSTVTAHIRDLEFQQGIWRYHPQTKQFELFAEGGGNTWGLDFNEEGEILAGTNFDEKMIHQVQGAYYVKNFGKHGALHNPHAYGYFGHVPYTGYRGGHISIGGVLYHGAAFAPEYDGTYIFGNTLDHAVYWARMQRKGSSFTASFGGPLLKTDDELFRPVDCAIGPDGALYVADWCDKRASHVDPLDTWDRSNGRIYRIQNRTAKPVFPQVLGSGGVNAFDLSKLSSDQLVDLLTAPNAWFGRQARLLLAERRDRAVWPRLRQQILKDPKLALPSLWALFVSGGFDDSFAAKLLASSNAPVRAWTVRLLGDNRRVPSALASQLSALARSESSVSVRAQLACTAKRLPGPVALPMIEHLIGHDEDASDPQLPLLIWWALEDKAVSDQDRIMKLFGSPQVWRRPIVQQFLLERLARRYAEQGDKADLAACAQLLQSAPDEKGVQKILLGIEQGLSGREATNVPAGLSAWFKRAWPTKTEDPAYVRFGLRMGDQEARQAAIKIVKNPRAGDGVREELIMVLSGQANPDDGALLLSLVEKGNSDKVREAALRGIQSYSQTATGEKLLGIYPQLSAGLQERVRDVLSRRVNWARLLVEAVDAGEIKSTAITLEQIRKMSELKDAALHQQVEKRWGKIQTSSPDEKKSAINQLMLVLKPSGVVGRDAKGDVAAGKKVFQQACALCHRLFNEGNTIGPDLTGADRKNTHFLLTQIVNPSGFIRPEYVSFEAEFKDQRILSGLMVESSAGAVTLLDRNNERHPFPRNQIKALRESAVSLMPEGLLEALPPQSVMDLFAYLQGDGSGVGASLGSPPP